MTWPTVIGESQTLDLVLAGHSLARFGDGEFALAENRSIRTQRAAPDLAERLREIVRGDRHCLVGVPNLAADLPPQKAKFWAKYQRCTALLTPDYAYVSSFMTRPDNAPWLDTPSYWARLERLWAKKDVVLVRGTDPLGTGGISLLAADLRAATSVIEIVAPAVNAWTEYASVLAQIGTPEIALLCLGPTATVLAVDLCRRGVHAVDLGHCGMFLHRHMQGLPMARTKAEKALSV